MGNPFGIAVSRGAWVESAGEVRKRRPADNSRIETRELSNGRERGAKFRSAQKKTLHHNHLLKSLKTRLATNLV